MSEAEKQETSLERSVSSMEVYLDFQGHGFNRTIGLLGDTTPERLIEILKDRQNRSGGGGQVSLGGFYNVMVGHGFIQEKIGGKVIMLAAFDAAEAIDECAVEEDTECVEGCIYYDDGKSENIKF